MGYVGAAKESGGGVPFPQNGLLAARVALIGLSDSWGEEFC